VSRTADCSDSAAGLRVMMLESGGWGGIHYYAHALGNALVPLVADLVLLTHERYELEDQPCGFRLLRVLRRESYVRTLLRVGRILRRERPHILHVQSLISQRKDLLLLLLCRLFGARLVLTVHNILPHEVRHGERLVYALYYRLAQALIVHSQRNQERLLAGHPWLVKDRVWHIPHGNYAHFAHLACGQEEARRRLGLPVTGRLVLFFGAIRPYKGLDLFLRLVRPVRQVRPEAFFVVAGNVLRGQQSDYEQQIESLGLGADDLHTRFAYLSNEEAIRYLCAADLVVLPYREIYQSGVLLFSYTFGRPVLATRVGSFPETVEHGQTGWLVPPEDVEAMVDTLIRVLREPGCLAEAGERARQTAAERYGWTDIAETTTTLYRQVMAAS
jgi:D-inositol-3-phosphate glycosyltransferase